MANDPAFIQLSDVQLAEAIVTLLQRGFTAMAAQAVAELNRRLNQS